MKRFAFPVLSTLPEKSCSFETGRLASLADGAVVVQIGDTTLLSTVCTSKPREGIDFFPLTVDVEERMYAAGKIPGSFFRREGRPSEQAVLICRLTDRPLRPSLPRRLPQRGAGDRDDPRRRPWRTRTTSPRSTEPPLR